MGAVPQVRFVRADGAELAMMGARVLERTTGNGTGWTSVAILEGSPSYRRDALWRIAEARGYVETDPEPATVPELAGLEHEPGGLGGTVARGQLGASAGVKRRQVVVEAYPDPPSELPAYRARVEVSGAEWCTSPSLAGAVACALELALDAPGLDELAHRPRPEDAAGWCPACAGAGTVHPLAPWSDGQWPVPCPSCKGTGQVPT
jgi:hypothetical protein